VDQVAENLAASYSRRGQVPDRGCGDVACVRWPQVPGPVRTMPVIVRDVVIQHRPQVPRPRRPASDRCTRPGLCAPNLSAIDMALAHAESALGQCGGALPSESGHAPW